MSDQAATAQKAAPVQGALSAFWAEIEKAYPWIADPGRQSEIAGIQLLLEREAERAVRSAYALQLVPGQTVITEDGYQLEVQADGSLTDGDMTFESAADLDCAFELKPSNKPKSGPGCGM